MSDPRSQKASFDRGVRSRIALNVTAVSLLAVVIVAFLNYGLDLWSRQHDVRFDLTRTGYNRLDDETRRFLRGIDRPLDVYVVTGIDDRIRSAARTDPAAVRPDTGLLDGVYRPLLDALVQRIASVVGEAAQVNPEIRLQVANAAAQPDLAATIAARLEMGPGELRNRMIVRDPASGAQRSFDLFGMFDLDLGGPDRLVGFRRPLLRGDWVEAHLVWGIRATLSDEPLRIRFSVGHGERELPALRPLLAAEGAEIAEIDVESAGAIPADCDVLVIASPSRPFSAGAREAVAAYVGRGGRTLILQGSACVEGFDDLLETWGLEMTSLRIGHPVENVRERGIYTLSGTSFLRDVEGKVHPITEVAVHQRLPMYFGFARAYETSPDYLRERHDRSVLAHSGPEGLGMPWIHDGSEWRMAPERGTTTADMPFMFAIESRAAEPDGVTARTVLVGSDEWLDVSALLSGFNLANGDVVRNAISWLGSRDRLIAGSPRRFRGNLAPLDAADHRTFRILVVGVVPALLALAGLLVLVVRHRT